MSRITLVGRIVAVVVVLVGAGVARAAEAEGARRPNVVVILADDMGFSDVGCYGSEIDTPNIDALAKGGVRFTQFYNTARCCPTRACLLTGLYPHQAGMGHMTGRPTTQPGYRAELSHEARTIAEVLHGAGYATYMTGKWHVTSHVKPGGPKDNWPRQRGFDRYYGTIQGGGSYGDPAMLTRDNTPIAPGSDPEYKPTGKFYYTTAVAENAARFVKEHKSFAGEKPFFMYVAFTAPHWPLQAPAEAVEKYKGKYDVGYGPVRKARLKRQQEMGIIDPKWGVSAQAGDWDAVPDKAWEARCMEVYAAQVDVMDQGIGKVMAALKETGELDNTLVLFMSDNGGCAEKQGREESVARGAQGAVPEGQPQTAIRPRFTREGKAVRDGRGVMPGPEETFIAYGQGWANVSNTPFKEYKHWVHEGGVSTPLIAYWPGGIARHGELEPTAGHMIDVMATCVDVAGTTYPKDAPAMEGVSLVKAMRGQKVERTAPIFWEHEGNRAVREGKWKLVAKGVEGKWELYDMDADRTEMHDLAGAEPSRVKEMGATWQAWAERAQVLPMLPYAAKGKGPGGGE